MTVLQQLRAQKQRLTDELSEVNDAIAAIEFAADRRRYNCRCVRQYRDIGVYDMIDQEAKNRNGLTLGWVSQALSADRACSDCHGNGRVDEK